MYIRHKMTSFPLENSSIAHCVLTRKINRKLELIGWQICTTTLQFTIFIVKTQEATLELSHLTIFSTSSEFIVDFAFKLKGNGSSI